MIGYYMVLFIDRVNSKTHDKKDLPQNNGGLELYLAVGYAIILSIQLRDCFFSLLQPQTLVCPVCIGDTNILN